MSTDTAVVRSFDISPGIALYGVLQETCKNHYDKNEWQAGAYPLKGLQKDGIHFKIPNALTAPLIGILRALPNELCSLIAQYDPRPLIREMGAGELAPFRGKIPQSVQTASEIAVSILLPPGKPPSTETVICYESGKGFTHYRFTQERQHSITCNENEFAGPTVQPLSTVTSDTTTYCIFVVDEAATEARVLKLLPAPSAQSASPMRKWQASSAEAHLYAPAAAAAADAPTAGGGAEGASVGDKRSAAPPTSPSAAKKAKTEAAADAPTQPLPGDDDEPMSQAK